MNALRQRLRSAKTWVLPLFSALLVSCTAPPPLPPLDPEWNKLNVWHKVQDKPPTYIPTGYSESLARTENQGMWFTDPRDGKRVFVPFEPVGMMDTGVLEGEAKKVTAYVRPRSKGEIAKDNAVEFMEAMAPLFPGAMPGGGGCHR